MADSREFDARPFHIPYQSKMMDAIETKPIRSPGSAVIVLTHGAGGDMNTKQLLELSESLAKHGHSCIRFTCKGLNIKYRTKVYKEVLLHINTEMDYKRIFVGGRSMGSRAAVIAVNELRGTPVEEAIMGVICLSYPLHPPGETSKLRNQPLFDLEKPVLFLSGTDDELCDKALMSDTLASVKTHEMIWMEGADHSLTGGSVDDRIGIMVDRIMTWCGNITQTVTGTEAPMSRKRKRQQPGKDTEEEKC